MRRTLALALGFATVVGLASPAAAAEAEAPNLDSPDHRVVVPMACKVMQRERQIGVACAWREAERPATGYRLGRLELGGRKIIFRTADLTKHSFLDLKVRPGLQYAYILQVLDGAGGVLGQSRHQLVLVRPNGDGDGDRTTTTTAPGSTATDSAARRPIGAPTTTPTSAPGGVANVRPAPTATTGPGQSAQAGQAAELARLRAQLEQLQQQLRQRQGGQPTTTVRPRPGVSTTIPTTPTSAGTPVTAAPPTTNGATRS